MKLAERTWTEVESVRDSQSSVLVLPVGATEQHGPHLPIETDSVLAESVCEAACESGPGCLLPTLDFTVSQGHTTKWPGTFSLHHETFVQGVLSMHDLIQAGVN